MKMPMQMKPPSAAIPAAGTRSSKPHLRMQKLKIAGKSAYPGGAAAFDPASGAPGGSPAFPAGDGGMGGAPGDAGE